ncbi:hypothetical protein BDL97_14G083600 [Sphagnum fallax]|nr:hypothetical protein BDL97_14G083600 [Sphagnum fallax]
MVFLDVVLTRLCECWFLGLGKVSNPSISSNTGIMVLVGVLDITGQPYILQTNVYAHGVGNREQRINL